MVAGVSAGAAEEAGQVVERTPFEVVPQVSMFIPSRFELVRDGVRVPYQGRFFGVASLQLGVAQPLASIGNVQLAVLGRAGYGYQQGSVVVDVHGIPQTDQVTLHWFPLSGGVRAEYHFPGVRFFKTSLTLGGGVQYFYQTGTVTPIAGGFWVPFVFLTPAVTFLEGNPVRDWFGGFTFGISAHQGLGPDQIVRGWTFDLSISLYL